MIIESNDSLEEVINWTKKCDSNAGTITITITVPVQKTLGIKKLASLRLVK